MSHRADTQDALRISLSGLLGGVLDADQLAADLERTDGGARRAGTGYAVAVLALDDYPELVEQWGAPGGELLTTGVGFALADGCRQEERVYHQPGGRFVVLLPGLDDENASARVHLLRRRAAGGERADPSGGDLVVRLSAGVAALDRHRHGRGETVLADAVLALAEAQHQGGNRVYVCRGVTA